MTRSYLCVSSMSSYIYATYGHKMVSSWAASWQNVNATLVVCFDDTIPADFPTQPNIHAFSLLPAVPTCSAFQARHQSPICSGRFDSTYSYRHDAKKFAFKVASVFCLGLYGRNHGFPPHNTLVWLDADTMWLQPMTDAFLEERFPPGTHVATFPRENYHSECGIVFYDLSSPLVIRFLETYWHLYTSDRIFMLPSWTDCDALDVLVDHFTKTCPEFRFGNLGTEASRRTGHPIVNSPWVAYVDHLKGARKQAGASYVSDKVLELTP